MRFAFFLLIVTAIISTSGCKNTTVVSGVITSSAGGPVDSAEVYLVAFYYSRCGKTTSDQDVAFTDQDGKYALELDVRNADDIWLVIKKEGYVQPKAFKNLIHKRDSKSFDYTLHPYDSWVKVTFENQSPTEEKNIYCVFDCSYFEGSHECPVEGCGPFLLQPKKFKSILKKVPGGTDVILGWDTKNFGSLAVPNPITVFCEHNDTTYVNIPF